MATTTQMQGRFWGVEKCSKTLPRTKGLHSTSCHCHLDPSEDHAEDWGRDQEEIDSCGYCQLQRPCSDRETSKGLKFIFKLLSGRNSRTRLDAKLRNDLKFIFELYFAAKLLENALDVQLRNVIFKLNFAAKSFSDHISRRK